MLANVLVGLIEYAYRNESNRLNLLPKPRDPETVKRKVLPSIARKLSGRSRRSETEKDAEANRLFLEWATRV
jgi:hypothetical protein